jgi:ATP-independent RNA helicase DbpA
LGYTTFTQTQELCIPYIEEGKNIIAQARTGSGKTLAFSYGIIHNLNPKLYRIQALVLAPTRELASQVAGKIKQYIRYEPNIKVLTLTGGVPYKPQIHSLKHLAHIIVGTPGRVLKHLENGNFSCEDINTFVLDEADRMLDMGFYEDMEKIISYLPNKRHNMLFSATYPPQIEKLSNLIMKEKIFLQVKQESTLPDIDQRFIDTAEIDKLVLTAHCFKKTNKSIILFANTKIVCDEIADYLENHFSCHPLVLHSDYEQNERDEILTLFQNKSYPLLIATDVAARGLDIQKVDLVINYDLPENPEVYIHRIGRTARAGERGESISFVDDKELVDEIESLLDQSVTIEDPKELLSTNIEKPDYEYSTLYISGGKGLKLRAGDILGALTAGIGLDKNDIGKIDIFPRCSYVAVKNEVYEKAFNALNKTKIKNKFFRVYKR